MRQSSVTQGHMHKGHRRLISSEKCGCSQPFSRFQLEGISLASESGQLGCGPPKTLHVHPSKMSPERRSKTFPQTPDSAKFRGESFAKDLAVVSDIDG